MLKPLLKIWIGIAVFIVFIYTGIPFEIENASTEAVFRTISFALIFSTLYILFKQVKKINNTGIRIVNYLVLGLFSLIFVIGALWNDLLLENSHGNWYNLEVCTNKSGTTILRQMRETSGSIYDYRDRLVLYEFDKNNRISINTNVKYHSGPWTVYSVNKTKEVRVQQLN